MVALSRAVLVAILTTLVQASRFTERTANFDLVGLLENVTVPQAWVSQGSAHPDMSMTMQ